MNFIASMSVADIGSLLFVSLLFLIWLLSYVLDKIKHRGAK